MKYVSVYRNGARPHWYVAYPDAGGERRCECTPFLIDDPTSKRKAYDYACQKAKEASTLVEAGRGEAWDQWVPSFMEINWRNQPKTLRTYEVRWKALRFWLRESGILVPRAVKYEHAREWLAYRTSLKRHRGTYYNFNTALAELRLLGTIMREAVRRGFAPGNPIAQLGIKKAPHKEKPEITDEEDAKIRSELLSRPVWMRECYHIAMCHGCRLTETKVPMERIDLARGTVTFHGKGNKVFTTQIHPALRPLAEAKKKVGARHLCDLPPMPAKEWWKFFREVGLAHLCFHCTKVTVITKLCRAGVPQGVAMSFVNHAKEEVHRVYQRLKVADTKMALDALAAIPALPATPGAPESISPPAPVSYRVRRTESPLPS